MRARQSDCRRLANVSITDTTAQLADPIGYGLKVSIVID